MTVRIAFHSENGPGIGGSDVLMGVIAGHLPRDRYEIYALTRDDYPLASVFRYGPPPRRIGDATAANSGQPAAAASGAALPSAGRRWKDVVRDLVPTAVRRRLGYRRSERRVTRLMLENGIQIFQTMDCGPQPTILGAAAAGCAVVAVHSAPPPNPPVDRLTLEYSRRSSGAAQACVAMSRFTAAQWEQFLGWPSGAFRVIYNGVQPLDDVASARRRVRSELALGADVVVVGMTGRLEPEKGTLFFAAAAARLAQEFPRAMFVFTGTGSDEMQARRIVGAAGLTDRARFLGFREDAQQIVAAYDVAVVPSVFAEPFGLVATEAMAAEVPVVVSAVGGLPEVVDHGAAGVLVPPSDDEALACALAELLRDGTRRRALAAAGAQRVAKHFTRQQMIEAYLRLYEEVAALHAEHRTVAANIRAE